MFHKKGQVRNYLYKQDFRKWPCERIIVELHKGVASVDKVIEAIGSYPAGDYFVEIVKLGGNHHIIVYCENVDDLLLIKMLDINDETFA